MLFNLRDDDFILMKIFHEIKTTHLKLRGNKLINVYYIKSSLAKKVIVLFICSMVFLFIPVRTVFCEAISRTSILLNCDK